MFSPKFTVLKLQIFKLTPPVRCLKYKCRKASQTRAIYKWLYSFFFIILDYRLTNWHTRYYKYNYPKIFNRIDYNLDVESLLTKIT